MKVRNAGRTRIARVVSMLLIAAMMGIDGFFVPGAYAASADVTHLQITSSAQTIQVGVESAPLNVQTLNAVGDAEQVDSTTVLNLDSSSATGEFSDSNATTCDGTSWGTSTLTMSSGTANKHFCYRDTTAGTHTITISSLANPTWTSATQTIEITVPVPAVPLAPAPTTPACDSSSFDSFTLGSVNEQGGWTSTGPYDQAVTSNSYGFSTFGCKSLRISNAVTSGAFGDQTFSFSNINEAGEVEATSGGMSGGTRQNRFEAQFDVATASTSQQSGLSLSVSPDRGDGSRMSYVRFDDDINGVDVTFYDVQGTSNPANFVPMLIADDLSRAVTHTVKFVMDFVDGPSNDVVKVYIDGTLVHAGTSWENYYRFDSEASAEQTPRTTDSLIFRAGGTAVPAHSGNGFLFDNLSLVAAASPPAPTVIYVDDSNTSGVEDGTQEHPFNTISEGIDEVITEGTIQVASGSYVEQLTIIKSLSLIGESKTNTFIQAPTVLSEDSDEVKSLITISGSEINVDLSGFTISGPGPSGCNSINAGIFVRDGATANIHDNSVLDIRDNPFSGCQNGIGIQVGRNLFETIGTATIANNEISGYQKGGIVIDNTGSSANITSNIVTGTGDTSVLAQNGIQISRGANALVIDNQVSGNSYLSTGLNSSGAPEPVCTGNGSGLSWADKVAFTESCWTSAGILLFEQGPELLVTDNTISSNQQGVDVFSSLYSANIESSIITGNSLFGVNAFFNTEGPMDVDATNNWWGSISGPRHAIKNPSGTGDAVSDNVRFIPWCTNPECTSFGGPVIVTYTDPKLGTGSVLPPSLDENLTPGSTARYGVNAKYFGSQIPGPSTEDLNPPFLWHIKITYTGLGDITNSGISLVELGWDDEPPFDGTSATESNEVYHFVVKDSVTMVASGSCTDPDCVPVPFGLDENDEFENYDQIAFGTSASLGDYKVHRTLMHNNFTPSDTSDDFAYSNTFTQSIDIVPSGGGGGGGGGGGTPTPTPSPTPSASPTPTPFPTATPFILGQSSQGGFQGGVGGAIPDDSVAVDFGTSTPTVSPTPSGLEFTPLPTDSDNNNGLASIFGAASTGRIILWIAFALLLILLLLWLLSRSRSDKDQGPPDQGGTAV